MTGRRVYTEVIISRNALKCPCYRGLSRKCNGKSNSISDLTLELSLGEIPYFW